MTSIIKFIFDYINYVFNAMSKFEFELLGIQTNILYIALSIIVITFMISFLRFGLSLTTSEIARESVRHRLNVNRKNKETDEKSKSRWI